MSQSWLDTSFYLVQKAKQLNAAAYQGKTDWNSYAVLQAIEAAGMTVESHYDLYGAYESGVNANRGFDDEAYYEAKVGQLNATAYQGRTNWTASEVQSIFQAQHISPIEHYLAWGKAEGLKPASTADASFSGFVSLSGDAVVDSLLQTPMPSWNQYYSTQGNVLTYSFSPLASLPDTLSQVTSMNVTQQSNTRKALAEVTAATGITFQEVSDAGSSDIVFGNANLGSGVAGVTYWEWSGSQTSVDLNTYIYIDNDAYRDLAQGTYYYEVLLHEIGHAMGLKHPFEGTTTLPTAHDNTSYTLMSYTHTGVQSTYQEFDLLALQYLYGLDGLGGMQGIDAQWAL